jgi:hypothetical protein
VGTECPPYSRAVYDVTLNNKRAAPPHE